MISSIRFKWNKFSPPPKKLLPRYLLKARSWGGVLGGPVRRVLRACKRYIDLWRVCWRAGGFFFSHLPAAVRNRRHSVTPRINLGINCQPLPPALAGEKHTYTHTGIPAGWEGATHGCAGWGSAGCRCSHWMQQQRVEIPPHGCTAHDQLTSPPANCHHEILLR